MTPTAYSEPFRTDMDAEKEAVFAAEQGYTVAVAFRPQWDSLRPWRVRFFPLTATGGRIIPDPDATR